MTYQTLHRRILFPAVFIVSVLLLPARAKAAEPVERTETVTVTLPDGAELEELEVAAGEQLTFLPELEEGDQGVAVLHLADVIYTVTDRRPVTRQETLTHTVKSDLLYSRKWDAPSTVQANGVTYTLYDVTYTDTVIRNRSAEMSVYTDYPSTAPITAADVPATKVATYDDPRLGREIRIDLPLKEVRQLTPYKWGDGGTMTITLSGYGSLYYLVGGVYIPAEGDVPPLAGYEDVLLKQLGLDAAHYRIGSMTWAGAPYEKSGSMCRDAKASVQRYGATWRAEYGGSMPLPDVPGHVGTAQYKTVREVRTGQTVYTVRATARYEMLPVATTATTAAAKTPSRITLPEAAAATTTTATGGGMVAFFLWISRRPVVYYNADGKRVGSAGIRRKRAVVPKRLNECITAEINAPYARRHFGQTVAFVRRGTAAPHIAEVTIPAGRAAVKVWLLSD